MQACILIVAKLYFNRIVVRPIKNLYYKIIMICTFDHLYNFPNLTITT